MLCAEGDWRRAEAQVTQTGDTARVVLAGEGDLDAAAAPVCRFLALDVDGRGWPEAGRRDPVIAGAQARLPGLQLDGLLDGAALRALDPGQAIERVQQVNRWPLSRPDSPEHAQ